jgi:hypothetical protein
VYDDMRGIELPRDHRVVVFSLETGQPLAERVCRQLGITPGRHEERSFEDGEHKTRPLEALDYRTACGSLPTTDPLLHSTHVVNVGRCVAST